MSKPQDQHSGGYGPSIGAAPAAELTQAGVSPAQLPPFVTLSQSQVMGLIQSAAAQQAPQAQQQGGGKPWRKGDRKGKPPRGHATTGAGGVMTPAAGGKGTGVATQPSKVPPGKPGGDKQWQQMLKRRWESYPVVTSL